MAVLVSGFKVPDFSHFCRRFQKPSHFSKSRLAPKKPSIYFEKAGKVLASTRRRSRLKIEESAGKRERDSLFLPSSLIRRFGASFITSKHHRWPFGEEIW
jgi:hypothetical protein